VKTIPFWTDQLPRPSLESGSALPSEADIVIVGGGFTGLSAARVLVRQGATVLVLERHTIGWGASSRNGGLATTGIKKPISAIFKRYGSELGRQFWQASLDAIDLIGEIVQEEGIDCDYSRDGHIALAWKPAHFRRMQGMVAWYEKHLGHRVRAVPVSELRSEIGTDAYHGGLVDEHSGSVNPAKYVFELARAAERHGAMLFEACPVIKLEPQSKGFDVHTNQGVVVAKEVVVATNGYTDLLVPKLKPRVFPVGSYIIVTEPLAPGLQRELSPKGRMFYDSKQFLNYFRLTPDGRMLFGGRNDLSTDLDLKESANRLNQQMLSVFPELVDVPMTHSWTGQLGITFDLMPHIGRVDGVHYAFGYGGHGVSIATYLGTEIGLILSGKKTRSPFAEIPHQTKFFYRNRPWFVPIAARYFRARDWLT
jgi:glycine/D-amino acid oxidase-like deaminating enzyme